MRQGGGKAKGAAFERLVCRSLSMWLSRGTRDDLFWRSAMSGGRATVGKKKGLIRESQLGDVSSLLSRGDVAEKRAAKLMRRCVIECKFLATIRLEAFLVDAQGPVRNAWDQCMKADPERFPFLVMKQNRRPAMVITTLQMFDNLCVTPVVISHAVDGVAAAMPFETLLEEANLMLPAF